MSENRSKRQIGSGRIEGRVGVSNKRWAKRSVNAHDVFIPDNTDCCFYRHTTKKAQAVNLTFCLRLNVGLTVSVIRKVYRWCMRRSVAQQHAIVVLRSCFKRIETS